MERDFDETYYASYTSVLRVVRVLVPTVEDAHDVAQEAYARALARWDSVSRLDSPEGWVRHVAVNVALDAGRRERGRWRAYQRWLHLGPDASAPAPDAASVDLVRALQALKPAQRQALVLHYLLDMSVEAIAEQTGRPTGTIKTNLSRGRVQLSKLLRDEGQVRLDV